MSTTPKQNQNVFDMDFDTAPELTLKDVITDEMYMFIVMSVVHEIADGIIQQTVCVVCGEDLHERAEGQVIDPSVCWFHKTQEPGVRAGHYYCKNSSGTLLAPNVKITKDGGITELVVHDKTPSILPFDIYGNEKGYMKASTDGKGLEVKIDAPGYTKSEIVLTLSKTSFTDFAIDILMDNNTKGSREMAFKISAEIYNPEACIATTEDGVLTLNFPHKQAFGIKKIPIKGAGTGLDF